MDLGNPPKKGTSKRPCADKGCNGSMKEIQPHIWVCNKCGLRANTENGTVKFENPPVNDIELSMELDHAPDFLMIHRPPHYTQGHIEVWDFIVDQGLNFLEGNVIKYICRARRKGTLIPDLHKAQAYLTKLIQVEEDIAVGKATAQKTTIVCGGTDAKTGKPCGRKATLVWKDGTALCRQCFNEMAEKKFPTNKSGVME